MDSLFAAASKDLAATEQKAITEEISNNYHHLEQAKSIESSTSDASYSTKETVRDFRDKEHKEPDAYLRSIALDKNIADKIDYASDMGSKIKEIVQEEELHKREVIKGSITTREVMAQITEQVAEGNEKEEYVYTDFQGNRYDNKESYLRAVAADKNMANKINYNSNMGRQIEAAVSVKERK
jgi:hypothetical protein